MPRKSPTNIQETRITFGNFERQFITEVKTDIENTLKTVVVGSAVATVGTGLVVAGGVGYMGYFIMKGLKGFALGLDDELDALSGWYNKWFVFTNATTGERESVVFNWYDYAFNNQEYNEGREERLAPLFQQGDNDEGDVVDWSALETVGGWMSDNLTVELPDTFLGQEMVPENNVNVSEGGKGTADYEEGEGSNWPFTEDWWPF